MTKYPRLPIFLTHFLTITRQPGIFIIWLLTSVVLALSSVWMPTLGGFLIGKRDWLSVLLESNPVILFSTVFLGNCLFASINVVGAGSNLAAMVVRGITIIVTVLYLIFLATLVPFRLLGDITLTRETQASLLLITLILGIYNYGFREVYWERSVDDVAKAENRNIESIGKKAAALTSDGSEVQL